MPIGEVDEPPKLTAKTAHCSFGQNERETASAAGRVHTKLWTRRDTLHARGAGECRHSLWVVKKCALFKFKVIGITGSFAPTPH